jgi:hypothetical protein
MRRRNVVASLAIVLVLIAGIFGAVAFLGAGHPSQNQSVAMTTEVSSTTAITVSGSLRSFAYLEWSQSTPASFILGNVKFTLWTNTTVTYSGGSCYGPSGGYAGYEIAFSDGSKEQVTTCTVGPSPPQTLKLTSHTNPQAGILIVPSTGQVFFLVSLIPPGNTGSISVNNTYLTSSNQSATTSTSGNESPRLYQLEFIQESNCPYGSWLVPWAVMLDNHTVAVQPSNATLPLSYVGTHLTSDSNYSTIWVSVPNGTYDYTILPKNFYGIEQNGTVTVNDGNIQVQISAFVTAMGCTTTSSG